MTRLQNVQYIIKKEKKLLKFKNYNYSKDGSCPHTEFHYVNKKLTQNDICQLFTLLDHLHYSIDNDLLKDVHNLMKNIDWSMYEYLDNRHIINKIYKIISKIYGVSKSNLKKALIAESLYMCELEFEIDENFDTREEYKHFLGVSLEIRKSLEIFIKSFET